MAHTAACERGDVERRAQGLALAALAGISAIYFFAYFHRVAIPGSIFDELQTAFQAPASAITALGMLFLYVYGGMQIVAGLLTDRLGAARILLWGGGLLTLGALCFPLAPTLPLLYAARIVLAFGASLVFAGLVKGIASLFGGRHFPILLGIALSVGYAGGLAGTLPFVQAAAHWGWRPALLGVGMLGLLALLAAAGIITRPGPLREAAASHPGLRAIGMVLRNRRAWPVMVVAR